MKNEKSLRSVPRRNCERAEQDEIFCPDENLFSKPEGQSHSLCHPPEFKNQKVEKKLKKDSFDEI